MVYKVGYEYSVPFRLSRKGVLIEFEVRATSPWQDWIFVVMASEPKLMGCRRGERVRKNQGVPSLFR